MSREAMKLALEALEMYLLETNSQFQRSAVTALREALAEQPAQIAGFDVVLDASMPPNTMKFVQPAQPHKGMADYINQVTNGRVKIDPVTGDVSFGTLFPQPAQQEPVRVPVTDNTYNYAKSLAEAIFKQHFASDEHYASGRIVWGVNDTVIGILTQIDNMVADMVRRPAQQQEPVAWITQGGKGWLRWHNKNDDHLNKTSVPLYKHPKRKPLSDAEIALISAECSLRTPSDIYFARAIEAAHGIKENT